VPASRATAICIGLVAVFAAATQGTGPAMAVPSFAVQTGQPCATCHIGAFGPQLTPQGRDFKLHGYVNSDGRDHGLPLAFTVLASFTHTQAPLPAAPAPGFNLNNNIALDQAAIYYAGRIVPDLGGFIKLRYNAIRQQAQVSSIDIRYAQESQWFGQNVTWGVTANNSPTVQDPWNSTPNWAFPYVRSSLAPTPVATPLASFRLSQRVAGVGLYTLWNDFIYWEADVYKGLNPNTLEALGQLPVNGSDVTTNILPYGRIAFIRDWERHHVEVGTFAMSTTVIPGRNQTFGIPTRKTDIAADATYQFITDPAKVISDRLSAHALYIHEAASTDESVAQALTGELLNHRLDTFRFDVSYSFAATVTPSVQYFKTTGTTDIKYWGTTNGSPNSDGLIVEVAYVPWGKPDSPFPNVNLRLTAQYVNYFSFNGTSTNARNNNTFFFGFQTASRL
jgi:hypothetical protein